MFPYSDLEEIYWTGYFTSRPNAKRQARQTSSMFHASSKLAAGKMLQQTPKVPDETHKQVLQNKEAMLNAIGIMQHHDAITGTAKQAVADDYERIMTEAVDQNNALYAQLVGEKASQAGLEESLEWNACQVSTLSPVDCGIDSKAGQVKMIAVHNPATIDQELLRMRAPDNGVGAFMVHQIDESGTTWQKVPSDLVCHCAQDTAASLKATPYLQCELFIKVRVPALGLVYLKVESVEKDSEDATSIAPVSRTDKTIENEHVRVEFIENIKDEGAYFQIHDLQSGEYQSMVFAMKYYKPST